MKLREYFFIFLHKENKYSDFIQQFVSSASPYGAILESIHWT